jgi:predicted amidohydrolase
MWNIGYTPFDRGVWERDFKPRDPEYREAILEWQTQAIERNSAFIDSYRQCARELDMAIAITYLEKWPGAPRNSASLVDRHGRIVLTYAKVHTCDFSLEAACAPGDGFPVAALDTSAGEVKIGIMICFDREFPESARILMLNGAEIVLTPNACELEQNRLGQFRARAFENMVGVCAANYPGKEHRGRSAAYSPIAFDAAGSRETTLVAAGEEEGIWLANFDIDAIRDYRRREVWGNAFRKPSRYHKIVAGEVREPFLRTDAGR